MRIIIITLKKHYGGGKGVIEDFLWFLYLFGESQALFFIFLLSSHGVRLLFVADPMELLYHFRKINMPQSVCFFFPLSLQITCENEFPCTTHLSVPARRAFGSRSEGDAVPGIVVVAEKLGAHSAVFLEEQREVSALSDLRNNCNTCDCIVGQM